MLSKISIDVDHDNQPIISIEYRPSDDVRDKLVKKFLESFGGSRWAQFNFGDERIDHQSSLINNRTIQTAELRPICAYNLPEEVKTMQAEAENHLRIRKQLQEERPSTQ